jgi:hypothetical protein
MKNFIEIYKGFLIILDSKKNIYSVAYSDIQSLNSIDDVKQEIDKNLELTNKPVLKYRGVTVVRCWIIAKTVKRNGVVMFDNGFYYKVPIHPYDGTLYFTIDEIKRMIDKIFLDKPAILREIVLQIRERGAMVVKLNQACNYGKLQLLGLHYIVVRRGEPGRYANKHLYILQIGDSDIHHSYLQS